MTTRDDRGSVTAEAALVLPVLLAVTGLLVWLLGAGIAQVQCVDVARDAVRALARGEPEAEVLAEARKAAPDGADVDLHNSGDTVRLRVSHEATPPGDLLDQVLSIPVAATAAMPVEAGGRDG